MADRVPALRGISPARVLLTVPRAASDREKSWQRMKTKYGDFGLCSFGFLSLTNFKPLVTEFEIFIARPEMMALANLLEHPTVGSEKMSSGFSDRTDVKRSNKDLGRVVAIARLATGEDEDALLAWAGSWIEALKERFVEDWSELAARVGSGLRDLLSSPADLEEAHFTCVAGLLSDVPPTMEEFRIAALRLLEDVVRVVEAAGTQVGKPQTG